MTMCFCLCFQKKNRKKEGGNGECMGFQPRNFGFRTRSFGFRTGSFGFRTGSLGFWTGSLGFRTGSFGFRTGSLGSRTGSFGFRSGSLRSRTGSLRFGTQMFWRLCPESGVRGQSHPWFLSILQSQEQIGGFFHQVGRQACLLL